MITPPSARLLTRTRRSTRPLLAQTGVRLEGFEVVLGVHTGGALLAHATARLLGVAEKDVLTVRVSRYADDIYSPLGLARVALAQLRGSHDGQYLLREPPPPAALKGKRVLIIDDALASGGTLRTARDYCVASGAREVHGVGLKVLGGYWSASDEGERPKARELRLPSFTPWGTF